MKKTPEALQDIAATYKDARPRVPVKASVQEDHVPPLRILSSDVDVENSRGNQEKSNFKKSDGAHKPALTASTLMRGINTSALRAKS